MKQERRDSGVSGAGEGSAIDSIGRQLTEPPVARVAAVAVEALVAAPLPPLPPPLAAPLPLPQAAVEALVAAPRPPLPPPLAAPLPPQPALSPLFSETNDAFPSSQSLPHPPLPPLEASFEMTGSSSSIRGANGNSHSESNGQIESSKLAPESSGSVSSSSSSLSSSAMISMGQPIETGGPTLDCRLLARTFKSAPHCEALPPSSSSEASGRDGASASEPLGAEERGVTKRRQLYPSSRKNKGSALIT